MKTELLIVGAGAAGLSAARAAWDGGVRDILLADRNETPGGILRQCTHSGFGQELTGPEYAEDLIEKLHDTGVKLRLNTTVTEISADKTAILSSEGLVERAFFDKMILATGCRERTVAPFLIDGTRPEGLYTAGQAQELLNLRGQDIGKNILIMGSGDLGLIMARRFAEAGKRVIAVAEIGSHYGGLARNYRRCIEETGIPLWLSTDVIRLHGERHLSGVTVRRNGKSELVPCDTLVTAVGLVPERTLVQSLGTPDWLHLCGNCSRVHELVDSAVSEARRVGAEASRP